MVAAGTARPMPRFRIESDTDVSRAATSPRNIDGRSTSPVVTRSAAPEIRERSVQR
jgi:hypothetical protein